MTKNDYQDLYRETLLCLGQEFQVGKPFRARAGAWLCNVGGRLMNEAEVLELWWGPAIASRIQCDRARPHAEEVTLNA